MLIKHHKHLETDCGTQTIDQSQFQVWGHVPFLLLSFSLDSPPLDGTLRKKRESCRVEMQLSPGYDLPLKSTRGKISRQLLPSVFRKWQRVKRFSYLEKDTGCFSVF